MRAKYLLTKFVVGLMLTFSLTSFLMPRKSTIPYIDLRQPIYFVVDQSFVADCEASDKNVIMCLLERVAIFKMGLDDWFKHFAEGSRPKAIITFSSELVPVNAANTPIHLEIKEGGCVSNGTRHGACYAVEDGLIKIIFDRPQEITIPTSAHEFGHALGLQHKPNNSIMSYRVKNIVQPIDIMTLCALHQEYPPHDATWCEGSFYNSCLCPSESFESGDNKNSENHRVCE